MPRCLQKYVGPMPLFVAQIAVTHQARHADDRVHWSSDLMAHVGQELRLCPSCSVRASDRLVELLVSALKVFDGRLEACLGFQTELLP